MAERDLDLERLLDDLLDADPGERDRLLGSVETEHPDAAQRLRRMLAFALDDTQGPRTLGDLAPTLFGAMLRDTDGERLGTRLGPYEIESMVARGGMGVVYRASRVDGAYEQTVAVKSLPRLAQTMARRELFLQERANLARLEHPNIARIIDAGVTDDDHPYFIMEYVDGERIDEFCATLSQRERLITFLEVCDALSYCHRSFVVHGDIKPGNILVADGRVRLLDFGIGQWTKAEGAAVSSGYTEGFAAPEIEAGQPATVESDVFALGKLLHTLLTSARATDVAGDLSLIIAKCVDEAIAQRYVSVESVRRDVEAVLDKRPIASRTREPSYVFGRFLLRNWLTSTAVTAVMVSLVVGFSIALWQYGAAKREAQRAQESASFVYSLFDRINPEDAGVAEVSLRQLLDEAAQRIDKELVNAPDVRHDIMRLIANGYQGLGDYKTAIDFRQKVLDYYRATRDSPHADRAKALGALGQSYASAGSLERGREYAGAAIKEFDALPDGESLALATVLGQYALMMTNAQGGSAEVSVALQALDRKTEILRELAPDDAYLNYIHLTNLASGYDETGQYERGAQLKEQALQLAESNGYAMQPTAINTLCNLGYSLQGLGRWAAAEKTYEKCRLRRSARLGEDHPGLISTQQNLATVQMALGNFVGATAMLEKTVTVAARALPENSFTRLAVEVNLARAQILVGEHGSALHDLPNVLTRMQAVTGVNSPAAARVQSILGKAHFESGNLTEANQLLETAYSTLKASSYWTQSGHLWTSDVTVWRSEAAFAVRNVERARRLAREGLAMRRKEKNVQPWRIEEAQRVLDLAMGE
ncbi:MAG: serine/threonine-protein kinase [Pseudomonadota bacterium]